MNAVKRQVGKCLHVPEMVDRVREMGVEQISHVEKQFPFLEQRLPEEKVTEREKTNQLKWIESIATGLDNLIPWSPIPIGIGSLLGFIPFIGGAMGSILSFYQIYLSTKFGIPLWLLLRMFFNVLIAILLGLIPVLGGFFHMFYKSNLYNFQELYKWEKERKKDE